MWWKWTLFIILGISILTCLVSTTIEWIKKKTGPFGPNPINWWGCGIFTIILGLLMLWLGNKIF